jgi:hypothetical protein
MESFASVMAFDYTTVDPKHKAKAQVIMDQWSILGLIAPLSNCLSGNRPLLSKINLKNICGKKRSPSAC